MGAEGTIVHVVGARPNYMKVAPVYAALARSSGIRQRLVHTGQHYDRNLKDVFFGELPLPAPDRELAVGSGTHAEQTAKALIGLEQAFLDYAPDLVVVPGDVNSTLAGALAAVKLGIPVAHVEAGLRSWDASMPEEHNRVVADRLSQVLLTHSEEANTNLRNEGVPPERIAFVGNTMIDTLVQNTDPARALGAWTMHGRTEGEYLLVTLHRPSLVDVAPLLKETLAGLAEISTEIPVIFPVHPRTRVHVRELDMPIPDTLTLTEPLAYRTFLSLELGARAVLTDSGGVQEETTALGIPCFTLRNNTERPVTITDGTNTLLGLRPERIREIPSLLKETHATERVPPLWDGHAGRRAAETLLDFLSNC